MSVDKKYISTILGMHLSNIREEDLDYIVDEGWNEQEFFTWEEAFTCLEDTLTKKR